MENLEVFLFCSQIQSQFKSTDSKLKVSVDVHLEKVLIKMYQKNYFFEFLLTNIFKVEFTKSRDYYPMSASKLSKHLKIKFHNFAINKIILGCLRERSQHGVRPAGRLPGVGPVPERVDALQGRVHHLKDEPERLGHGLTQVHRAGQHAA
jgi:hypothetical protein